MLKARKGTLSPIAIGLEVEKRASGRRGGKGNVLQLLQTTSKLVFTAWTVPEAIVDVYDSPGVQTVDFCGEEVLASPESLMLTRVTDGLERGRRRDFPSCPPQYYRL